MPLPVKICGLTREADIDAAVAAGADYLGFIFFPPSKRSLSAGRWRELGRHLAGRRPAVGVFVDAEDDWLAEVMAAHPLDFLQLHGRERPERARELAQRFERPVIKAMAIAGAEDIEQTAAYDGFADMFLFDAKPPKVPGAIPGGNGLTFDWRLMAGRDFGLPWMLSGGISAANLATAVQLTGAPMVDMSSSVEDAPGIKNHARLQDLLAVAKTLETPS